MGDLTAKMESSINETSIFAVLYVSVMGLTRCYKTTVFLNVYLYKGPASCGIPCNSMAFLFMVALCNRADHIYVFHPVSFFFFPRLISAVGDWMSGILPHMVWP